MPFNWQQYKSGEFYDELFEAPGVPRPAAQDLVDYLSRLSTDDLKSRRAAAEMAIKLMGISFTVYSEGQMIDRAWPFDIIPRVIPLDEWKKTEAGLKQRVEALNLFIQDIYNDQKIISDKVFPKHLIQRSTNFRKQCMGISPPLKTWAHICGTDLVRGGDGTVYVLEDNLRVPSGVSYMLENRLVTKRVFPEVFATTNIMPVDDYATQLHETLSALSPRRTQKPTIVLLTPGIYNSAYFEHAYLAQQMGIELVIGSDLFTDTDNCVYMKTIKGPRRVDVIYRRIDDLFLDPETFKKDSMLGTPGLMRAWLNGKVALANAPGAGVADDKVVYTYVPEFIKYYLGEDPILPNVPSYRCYIKKEREYVLKNIAKLVVKPANESGGYGMLVGPKSTRAEQTKFRRLIEANPRNYIAQPTLALSTAPTLIGRGIAPRHLDLRPFILSGKQRYVTTGGLTRVALVKGSLVVNSSQGGGSKDTWIVDSRKKPRSRTKPHVSRKKRTS